MIYFRHNDQISLLAASLPSTQREIYFYSEIGTNATPVLSRCMCARLMNNNRKDNHLHAKKFNSSRPSDAYIRVSTRSSLFQIMWCPLFGAKTLTEPMMTFCQLDPTEQTLMTIKRLVCVKEHYNDVIMSAVSSQITGVSIVCPTVCLGADQRKYQSSASLVFVRGFHRWQMDSLHKGTITRKVFPFDEVIMICV